MIAKVAVLLGLSDRDGALLDAVVAIGERTRLERVWLIHASEKAGAFAAFGAPSTVPPPAALEERAARLRGRLPDVDVSTAATSGRAAEEITRISEAEGLDLVVFGRAPSDAGRPAWGSRGLRILRTSDCPVLIVPNGTVVRFRSAVVGMDLSPNALGALALAVALCEQVRVVAVVDASDEPVDSADPESVRDLLGAPIREQYEAAAREAVARVRAEAWTPPEIEVVPAASPADALLSAAKDADLVAIGSRGLTPIAAVLLGSTAERLGGRCAQPLLVVRNRGENRGIFGGLLRR